jgi:hypothetical protein
MIWGINQYVEYTSLRAGEEKLVLVVGFCN